MTGKPTLGNIGTANALGLLSMTTHTTAVRSRKLPRAMRFGLPMCRSKQSKDLLTNSGLGTGRGGSQKVTGSTLSGPALYLLRKSTELYA